MSQEEQIRKVIRLKRHETPKEGYFEEFLEEFQSRRDQESDPVPAKGGVGSWFQKLGFSGWLMGGGLAYAALILVIFWWPRGPETIPDGNRQPVIFQPGPEPTPVVNPEKPKLPEGEF